MFGSNTTKNTTPKQCSERSLKGETASQVLSQISTKKEGLTLRLVIAGAAAFLTNSFPSGYNMGVVNTPQEVLKNFCNETLIKKGIELSEDHLELLWSIAVSLLLVGAIIGSVFTGFLADRLGRKRLIFLNSCIGLIAISLFPISKAISHVSVFLIGRFVSGVHTGIASSIVPMYLMEISPNSIKGAMGAVHVLGLTGGILIAEILGLKDILGSEENWQLLFSLNAAFITVGVIALSVCPESPVYLFVLKGKEIKAITALKRFRNLSVAELQSDISAMKVEHKAQDSNNWGFISLMKLKEFRVQLFIVCVLHAGQQLVGINAVFYYSTMTFESIGLSHNQSQYGSIAAAAVNAIMGLVSIHLIKKYRRKTLLITSIVGTILCLIALTISMTLKDISWMPYVTITSIMLYVAIFGVGLGPIPYMIGGDLFEKGALSIGMSCGCIANWFSNFLIAIAFPLLSNYLNQYVFIIFIAFAVLLAFIVSFCLPENKNKSQDFETNCDIS